MRPATKACRAKIDSLNEGYKGVVVALKEGSFFPVPIRYEIVEIKRWTYGVSNLSYCTAVLRCLTDAEPAFGFVIPAVEDEIEEHTFSLEGIEELLRDGVLRIVSNIHQEDWYRPDQACMAV